MLDIDKLNEMLTATTEMVAKLLMLVKIVKAGISKE